MHNELITSHNKLKDEYTTLKINYDTLVIAQEFLPNEPHDATNHVVKIDIATSCDDLIDVTEPPNLYKIKYGCPRLTR